MKTLRKIAKRTYQPLSLIAHYKSENPPDKRREEFSIGTEIEGLFRKRNAFAAFRIPFSLPFSQNRELGNEDIFIECKPAASAGWYCLLTA